MCNWNIFLSYNLNKASEQNEYLSMSVVDRYVGVETATSYVRSPSSAKKRNMRMKYAHIWITILGHLK